MKDSSQLRKEFERLKEAYENAQKRKKKTKSAYKSQMKALKAQMKPYRLSYKQAQLAEHEAKVEYKSLLNKLKKHEDDGQEEQIIVHQPPTPEAPAGRGRRGRPRMAKPVAEEKPAGRRGRKRTAEPAPSGGGDDLTKVLGVGAKVADALRANGITTFADMAATSVARYKEVLKENGMSKFRNPTTWAQQAADLAGVQAVQEVPPPAAPPKEKGRRGRKPGAPKAAAAPDSNRDKTGKRGRKPAAEKPVASEKPDGRRGRKRAAEVAPTGAGDDLTKVLGVGEKVADVLRANGIATFADMAATSVARYKEVLKENGMSKFRNPTTWAQHAAALAGVQAVQEAPTPAAPPQEKGRRGRKPGFKPAPKANTAAAEPAAEGEPVKRRPGRQPGFKPTPKAKSAAAVAAPAAEAEPGKKRRGRQPGFKPMPKAPLAAAVATPAAEGEPVKRRPGRQPGFKPAPKVNAAAPVQTVAAAPRNVSGGAQGSDDLTKIKGIGDRVQTALNEFGIHTYADVAGTSLDRFKEILKARGMSKFRDPSSWAQGAAELTGG